MSLYKYNIEDQVVERSSRKTYLITAMPFFHSIIPNQKPAYCLTDRAGRTYSILQTDLEDDKKYTKKPV